MARIAGSDRPDMAGMPSDAVDLHGLAWPVRETLGRLFWAFHADVEQA